ncbi:hypothetical protein MKW98_008028 [Papaver atlanticum]|uniref:Transcription termination factor MTEF18, mitochondrial-like n=1 Tax=Papaver atlanticum TaxID=357466 RepID=A0AAD4SYQ6_9MAGN|nr:hypothetical protein MKW98_008028 [Papaver atlanticum]
MYLNLNLLSVTSISSVEPLNYFNLVKIQSFYSSRRHSCISMSMSRAIAMSDRSTTSCMVTRLARGVRSEAEDVLFDYLHYTRNLQFSDAEHISKNSPIFLRTLLSKVIDSDEEISRSLARFLRYNPINEFEPFFESLGLAVSEVNPLLPRELMFLSDDDILLENYHVLCNYGIPRTKIGKMCKEVMEIFGYDHGVLAATFRGYEELGLSKPTVIALVTCCPTLLVGGVNRDFVRFLTMLNGLGIERNWVREYLSDKNTYSWNRMVGVTRFLEEMGCSRKDMRILIDKHPRFLFEDSGNKIYILVALLLKIGISAENILSLFLQHPQILAGNFAKNLWGALHFLSEIKMETEDIAMIIRSHAHILGCCCLKKKPRTVLSNLKVGPDKLCEIIKEDPPMLVTLAGKKKTSHRKASNDTEKTTFLLNIGYVENSDELVKALKRFRGRGDQLQERFDCLVNAGLDFHDVCKMIKDAPQVLNQSKDVIEMKIKHLVNDLRYPVQDLVAFPRYLCYDIERVKLRFSMYVWLREKGVVGKMTLSTILVSSHARVIKYLVNLHSEGPAVWETLKKESSSN